MKIPKSFKLLSLIFGVLTFVSFYCFYNRFYFIGPWTHLLICIASLGLFLTIFIACIEWKRGKHDNKRNDREMDTEG